MYPKPRMALIYTLSTFLLKTSIVREALCQELGTYYESGRESYLHGSVAVEINHTTITSFDRYTESAS